jgi:hypothetical protein
MRVKMNEYHPDNWAVIFLDGPDPHYRILAGWSGGYAQSDSWRLNSGITRVEETVSSYLFYGSSGSCYVCGKDSYGLRNNNAYVWNCLVERHGDKVELMPEDTYWFDMDWILK